MPRPQPPQDLEATLVLINRLDLNNIQPPLELLWNQLAVASLGSADGHGHDKEQHPTDESFPLKHVTRDILCFTTDHVYKDFLNKYKSTSDGRFSRTSAAAKLWDASAGLMCFLFGVEVFLKSRPAIESLKLLHRKQHQISLPQKAASKPINPRPTLLESRRVLQPVTSHLVDPTFWRTSPSTKSRKVKASSREPDNNDKRSSDGDLGEPQVHPSDDEAKVKCRDDVSSSALMENKGSTDKSSIAPCGQEDHNDDNDDGFNNDFDGGTDGFATGSHGDAPSLLWRGIRNNKGSPSPLDFNDISQNKVALDWLKSRKFRSEIACKHTVASSPLKFNSCKNSTGEPLSGALVTMEQETTREKLGGLCNRLTGLEGVKTVAELPSVFTPQEGMFFESLTRFAGAFCGVVESKKTSGGTIGQGAEVHSDDENITREGDSGHRVSKLRRLHGSVA
ncbi:hypothetical protein CSUB01_04610 [Colletotrichum sublineola]|uniref:Uncharacterized protein n=1 Tax=Colletotrichum sublineola TaxID=1173701 RepID=A0A066XA19_COLSU|nr:hypothetical protein CSUB01_04610 [Colletotrichum sublineola]